MKLKTLSLLAGTLALTLIATPFAVQAQNNPPLPQPGQELQERGPFKHLNLNSEQKAKMKEIHTNTRAQIDTILTTEQKNQLKTAMEKRKAERQQRQRQHHSGHEKKGDIFNSLNLTDKQKDQIKQIHDSERQKMQAILTRQQQTQMKKFRGEMRSRRQ
ncbi:Spy/CpxP family protein refolding chaperone [Dolichospermum circinale]|uniref:Spy/CpxP family protein refolding chaperone n=1 Tax=Dolichospermum circinale TaxID=109265 RepID=UPI00232BE43C|nr:Spy/CpxP family protein refolding chaperone [Dolichospermum circinale]MDB9466004.1 Spy/CpxP family protein refolding chaperone [Dolichospermum circinale CS-539/09]MDB9471032.1 Spy/CpxP family protein refolding chaperone [Dolichospermum circinale CS-539]